MSIGLLAARSRHNHNVKTGTLGTLSTPAVGNADLNRGAQLALPPTLPVASKIKALSVWANAVGSIQLNVLQPVKGYGLSVISTQTLSCASTGVNTFSVAAGTLTEIALPANSLLGFVSAVSGGATLRNDSSAVNGNGYWIQFGANFTGTGQAFTESTYSPKYAQEPQLQFVAEYSGTSSPTPYWIDETFSSAIAPAYGVNQTVSPWAFASSGATCAGTGLASFYDFYPASNCDNCTWAVEFLFTGSSDRFVIKRNPILATTTAAGTVGEADIANNRLVLYAPWTGGTTLPASYATHTLSSLTLAIGVRYRLALTRVGRAISLTITDTSSSVAETLTVSGATTVSLCGYANGRPGFANIAGSAQVKSAQFFAAVVNPKVLLIGDSITEGYGVADSQRYAQLTLNNLAGNGRVCGNSSAVITEVLSVTRQELRLSVPKYVVIECVNNANSDALRDAYPAGINQVIALIKNVGAIPIVCTLSPSNSPSAQARIAVINSYILGLTGVRIARMDIALSAGGDGSTYDPSIMSIGVHPNAAGCALMAARLQLDVPEIFI